MTVGIQVSVYATYGVLGAVLMMSVNYNKRKVFSQWFPS